MALYCPYNTHPCHSLRIGYVLAPISYIRALHSSERLPEVWNCCELIYYKYSIKIKICTECHTDHLPVRKTNIKVCLNAVLKMCSLKAWLGNFQNMVPKGSVQFLNRFLKLLYFIFLKPSHFGILEVALTFINSDGVCGMLRI